MITGEKNKKTKPNVVAVSMSHAGNNYWRWRGSEKGYSGISCLKECVLDQCVYLLNPQTV